MKIVLRIFGVLLLLVLVVAGAAAAVVALNLRTYSRLTYEQPVATIEFQNVGPQRWKATVTRLQTNQSHPSDLSGDEWQVDARVLKWHGFANVLGLDAQYRLERLSGRFHDIEQERAAPHSVYPLHEEATLDFWSLASAHPNWIPWVDGFYGSATYLPMAQDARFEVSLTQDGLIARADNEAARAVSHGWR